MKTSSLSGIDSDQTVIEQTVNIFTEQMKRGEYSIVSNKLERITFETTVNKNHLVLDISSILSSKVDGIANLHRWSNIWKASLKIDGVYAYYNVPIEKYTQIGPMLTVISNNRDAENATKKEQAYRILRELS